MSKAYARRRPIPLHHGTGRIGLVMPIESRTSRSIGPTDHGRKMTLAEFSRLVGMPGYRYELDRGVIRVVAIPGIPHSRIVRFVRQKLELHAAHHPNQVNHLAGSTDSVVRVPGLGSERHPDITVYLNSPPSGDNQGWEEWIPDIVIEVVSVRGARADYVNKSADYLAAGVRQYWIIDPLTQSATMHSRRGDVWRKSKVARSGEIRTNLLPGFSLKLAEVLAAGR